MINKNHKDLTNKERDELEAAIDIAFRDHFIQPRKKAIVDFFVAIQKGEHEFRTGEDFKQIKVLDVFYYANCPLSHFTVEPCNDFYDLEKTTNSPELDLNYYTYSDVDDLIIKVLEEQKVEHTDLTEANKLDTAEFWENKAELEFGFIIDCWNIAKKKTNSPLQAFLHASDSSGAIYDLNNGESLWAIKNNVIAYLEGKGITIAKEQSDSKPASKKGFWKKLFGK